MIEAIAPAGISGALGGAHFASATCATCASSVDGGLAGAWACAPAARKSVSRGIIDLCMVPSWFGKRDLRHSPSSFQTTMKAGSEANLVDALPAPVLGSGHGPLQSTRPLAARPVDSVCFPPRTGQGFSP